MKLIEEKILKEGKVINDDIIKVDNFLNHQIDVELLNDFAVLSAKEFSHVKVDKILTIETSGIAIGYAFAQVFKTPLLFAKKSKSQITNNDVYHALIKSFTRNVTSDVIVSKDYLKEGENILIVDDFLAEGNAALGLIDICKQAKSNIVGFVAVVEKGFQGGRKRIEELGIKVVAGATIKEFKNNKPVF